jgi:hypothetical protein
MRNLKIIKIAALALDANAQDRSQFDVGLLNYFNLSFGQYAESK